MTTNEAPTVTVDPGQVIRINAHFSNSPAAIHFSFLPPQSNVAIHDPGIEEIGTQIQKDGDLYSYKIDTRDMHGGLGWWYFYSEDVDLDKRRAKVGKFIVNDVPRTLLERPDYNQVPSSILDNSSGLDVLGTYDDSSSKILIGIGVVIVVAILLL